MNFYRFQPFKIKILKNPFLVHGYIIIFVYFQNLNSITQIGLALR